MSTRYRSNGEIDFTRAASDEVVDSELTYDVLYVTRLAPSMQRGVWSIETCVYRQDDLKQGRAVVRQSDHWPSAATISFAAQLYQHLHKAARMVENWSHDTMRAEASR